MAYRIIYIIFAVFFTPGTVLGNATFVHEIDTTLAYRVEIIDEAGIKLFDSSDGKTVIPDSLPGKFDIVFYNDSDQDINLSLLGGSHEEEVKLYLLEGYNPRQKLMITKGENIRFTYSKELINQHNIDFVSVLAFKDWFVPEYSDIPKEDLSRFTAFLIQDKNFLGPLLYKTTFFTNKNAENKFAKLSGHARDPYTLLNQAMVSHLWIEAELLQARGIQTVDKKIDLTLGLTKGYEKLLGWIKEDPKTGILLYNYTDENILQSFLLTNDNTLVYEQKAVSEERLDGLIEQFRRAIISNSIADARLPRLKNRGVFSLANETPATDFATTNKELRETVLVDSIAKTINKLQKLYIMPVRAIGTIPFAALMMDDETHLIDKVSVMVLPSIDTGSQIYEIGRRRSRTWNPDFKSALVVGNPAYPSDKTWVFPDLPAAEEEAEYISGIFPSVLFTGKQATQRRIVPHLAKADLLYFATHGLADDENPLDKSFLVLADTSATDQSYLTAKEVLNMRMDASLVILSACQTGLGRVVSGGVIGLSRAFLIAGAGQVVMSLWNVNDGSAKEFMTIFFSHLEQVEPVRAMQMAIIDMREKYRDPLHWAPFTLFGTPF